MVYWFSCIDKNAKFGMATLSREKKEGSMKHSSRDYLIGVLMLTLAVVLLFGCATKSKTTQPEGTSRNKPSPR